jgi:hypothetical protein
MKTIEQACLEVAGDAPCGIPNYEEDDYNAGFLKGTVYGFEEGITFAQQWISVDDELPDPEDGGDFLLFNEKWIDEDFNPKGVRIGFYNPDVSDTGWTSARWSPSHDEYITKNDDAPTHWRPIEYK